MHRSQILLEQWQYEYLADEARRQGKSISELVRGWLTEWFASRHSGAPEHDPFFDIIGIVASGDGHVAENHDQYIYTTDWPRAPSE
jgi:hypothetical protein